MRGHTKRSQAAKCKVRRKKVSSRNNVSVLVCAHSKYKRRDQCMSRVSVSFNERMNK
jgi:hypothetical protein